MYATLSTAPPVPKFCNSPLHPALPTATVATAATGHARSHGLLLVVQKHHLSRREKIQSFFTRQVRPLEPHPIVLLQGVAQAELGFLHKCAFAHGRHHEQACATQQY